MRGQADHGRTIGSPAVLRETGDGPLEGSRLQPSDDADRRLGRRTPAPCQPPPEEAPGLSHNSPMIVTTAAASPRATSAMPRTRTMKACSCPTGEKEPPASKTGGA